MQVIFSPNGYIVDDGSLSYADVYHLAFDNQKPDDPGLGYLARIAALLVDTARLDPDISLTRMAKTPHQADFFPLLAELPYVLGAEFVNINWIEIYFDENYMVSKVYYVHYDYKTEKKTKREICKT